MVTQVVVLDDYQDVAREYADWSGLGPDVRVRFDHEHRSGDGLVRSLTGAEVVVAMRERTPFPVDVLGRLPDLRLLVTTGMKNASIDLDAARAQGVTVCGTGQLATAAAEHTWALILAALRHVPTEDALVRSGGWQATVGGDLASRTLGVVGLGRLGSRVARVARAFDMRVVAWSQHLTAAAAAEHDVERVEKGELFATADIVTLHLRLSDRTRGIVGRPELHRMKPKALLVNTSRGPLVDEAALVAALESGRLGGAALDVYDTEPLPADHPLRRAPRTVLTPHVGYVTGGSYTAYFSGAVEDIRAWLDGSPVRVLNG
ncbi:MAG TPA: D-2-hydroxyacid dehydrogenase family protein [Segeticoccus sp.]|nr:D-2-hydroxyacid dehydrogenase family protein [Segeticoccus sp.]